MVQLIILIIYGWFPGARIYVNGNIFISSDVRKKTNDINDDGALQQILAIQLLSIFNI